MTAMNSATHAFRTPRQTSAGATTGAVTTVLRLEGMLVLVGATWAYGSLSAHWLMFALLFLVPDLSMLGYLVNRAVGATLYNVGHSYVLPGLLALAGFASGSPPLYGSALIWIAHIGFDRMLGYGLKYPTAFGATHLGFAGRRP